MAEQEMLLDTATIRAAVAGELWAKQKVIEHYTPMIDELAVDEDMKQHLILKLLEELPNFPMGQSSCLLMCSKDGFRYAASLEQTEAEQNGIAHTAPDGPGNVRRARNVAYQHRIDAHDNHNQERLEA